VPTLGAVTTTSNGQSTQSIQYQKTGVQFDLKPEVFTDSIDLQIKQSITDAVRTQSGVNNTPTLKTREVSTSAVMRSGEAIVLAGLTSNKNSAGRQGLSFFPRWLDAETKDVSRTELLVFLYVEVVAIPLSKSDRARSE
jgi:general secretion pathway protein D